MKTILTAAALSLAAIPASASVLFDFSGSNNGPNGNYDGDYSATVDGITVSVTAGLYNGGGSPTPPDDTVIDTDCSDGGCSIDKVVSKRNGGLGISGGFLDSGQIDGFGSDELITFSFDQTVIFESITFSRVDSDDDFDLFFDATNGTLAFQEGIGISGPGNNPFLFSTLTGAPASGLSFSVGADDGRLFSTDDFRISSVQVSAVPLPAAGIVLLTALAGAGAVYRRRKAA